MNSNTMERFFQAVGASAPIRVVVSSPNSGKTREIEYRQPFILIGCHKRADLRLNSPEVSRRQLYVQLIGEHLFGVHLSSRVPSLWDAAARLHGWIDDRVVLKLGGYTLRFPDAKGRRDPAASDQNPTAAGSFAGPPATLIAPRRRSASQRIVIDRVVTLVGNSPFCRLRLKDRQIDGIDCILVQTRDGLWLVKILKPERAGGEGGARVRRLVEGDEFRIGRRRVSVHYASADPSPRADRPAGVGSPGPTDLGLAGRVRSPAMAAAEIAEVMTALAPVVNGLTAFQAQTFEQFKEMTATMIQAFAGMFAEHRDFVRLEMDRMDQLTRLLAERSPPSTATVSPAAVSPLDETRQLGAAGHDLSPLPPLDTAASEQVHVWLQQRIAELGEEHASLWERMTGFLRGKASQPPRK